MRRGRRLPRLLARFATLLIGIALALLVCELVVRVRAGESLLPLVPPEPYVDNAVLYRPQPTRLYELRPGVDAVVRRERIRIRINSAGMRDDREFSPSKPPGTLRVVVLGDSFAFGGKVQVTDTFSAALERELGAAAPSRTVEALNLAVPGYNTEQEMLSLKEEGLAYQPDLVIVSFVLNDAAPMRQLVPEHARLPLAVRRALKRFDLVQLAYGFSKQMGAAMDREGFGETESHSELAPGNPGWERARGALAEIARLSREHHAAPMVVVWPMLVDLDARYPYRAKHRLVVDECEKLGIPVFDLFSVFEGHDASALWASRDDHHPNAVALAMAAKAVAREVVAKGVIPVSAAAAK